MDFNAPIWLALVTTGLSILTVGTLFWVLTYRHRQLPPISRIGIGLIAAGLTMGIGPALMETTPFNLWASALVRVGILILAFGLFMRESSAEQDAHQTFSGREETTGDD